MLHKKCLSLNCPYHALCYCLNITNTRPFENGREPVVPVLVTAGYVIRGTTDSMICQVVIGRESEITRHPMRRFAGQSLVNNSTLLTLQQHYSPSGDALLPHAVMTLQEALVPGAGRGGMIRL